MGDFNADRLKPVGLAAKFQKTISETVQEESGNHHYPPQIPSAGTVPRDLSKCPTSKNKHHFFKPSFALP
jgi:hypothetical protein